MKKIICLILLLQNLFSFGQSQPIFTNCIGDIDDDKLYDAKITSDGGIIVVGYLITPGQYKAFFISKLDSNGNMEWEKKYGGNLFGDHAFSVFEATDGYVIAGVNKSNSGDITGNHGNWDALVVKVDFLGNLVWQKTFGGSSDEEAKSIVQTNDGGYIIAGYTSSNNFDVTGNHGGKDFWVVKLNASGNLVWQKTYGGTGNDIANSIVQTLDGGYIVAGISNSTNGDVLLNIGNDDFWIIKITSLGNIEWQKTFGTLGNDNMPNIIQTSDGGYAMVGASYPFNGSYYADYCNIFKINSTGDIEWQRFIESYNYSSPDDIFKIIETLDNGYAVIGSTADGDTSSNTMPTYGGTNLWFLKFDSLGNTQGQRGFGGQGNDHGSAIQQDASGNYYIVGYISSINNIDNLPRNGQVFCNHSQNHWDGWLIKVSADLLDTNLSNLKNKLNIFPNPTNSVINVELDPTLSNVTYELYDSIGRNLQYGKLSNENLTINITSLPNGIYNLLIKDDSNLYLNHKIIKQ